MASFGLIICFIEISLITSASLHSFITGFLIHSIPLICSSTGLSNFPENTSSLVHTNAHFSSLLYMNLKFFCYYFSILLLPSYVPMNNFCIQLCSILQLFFYKLNYQALPMPSFIRHYFHLLPT